MNHPFGGVVGGLPWRLPMAGGCGRIWSHSRTRGTYTYTCIIFHLVEKGTLVLFYMPWAAPTFMCERIRRLPLQMVISIPFNQSTLVLQSPITTFLFLFLHGQDPSVYHPCLCLFPPENFPHYSLSLFFFLRLINFFPFILLFIFPKLDKE